MSFLNFLARGWWRQRRRAVTGEPEVPAPISERVPGQLGRRAGLGFCALFILVGAGVSYAIGVRPLLKVLAARLRQLHYRAAIVGPKGTGKTTLLEDLASRLAGRGFSPIGANLAQFVPKDSGSVERFEPGAVP